jgi:hypothetical protein
MDGYLAPRIAWARAPAPEPEPSGSRRDSPSRGRPPRLSLQSLRDPILFVAGLAGIAHQTLIAPEVQWELLLAFMAMLGLPLPLRADERRRNGSNGS